MQILLCAATPFEIQPTLDVVRQKGWEHRIAVCITGIGLTAATYSITKAILAQTPDLIVQAGIAGSFDESLPPGAAVVIETEALGDAGVMENGHFKTLFDLGLLWANQPPWQEQQLANPFPELLLNSGLMSVAGISVNEISTDKIRIKHLKNNLNAAIESMEGAALHYAALQEGIPFLQLRSISNYVGERDKEKWKLHEAIESLNGNLQRILQTLVEQ